MDRGSTDRQVDELEFARATMTLEADAVRDTASRLDHAFEEAVSMLEACSGRGGSILVAGLGKSGLIGAKMAATLASLGFPSHTIHPTEAAHGDLGRIRRHDVVICLSYSGETTEVVNLAAMLRQDEVALVGITSKPDSTLAGLCSTHLTIVVEREAGGLAAPTCSTTATLALGDALALSLARRHNRTDAEFARNHPGGSLGGLLKPVTDVLRHHVGRNLKAIPDGLAVREALDLASTAGRRPGAMLLVDERGMLSGIFTDGDLRRLVLRDVTNLDRPIADVMTRDPRTILATALVRDAVVLVRSHRQDEIPVVDGDGRPVGLLDVQDLMTLRLVEHEE